MRTLHQMGGLSITATDRMYPIYSRRTIQRHAKKAFGEPDMSKQKVNSGRPTKVTPQDKRSITRAVKTLRRQEGANFTSGRIKIVAGVTHLSNRTVRRVLNQSGFRYLKSRKKGLLNAKYLQRRVMFCRKMQRTKIGAKEGISFYLDAKGLKFKKNPQDQARAPHACQ